MVVRRGGKLVPLDRHPLVVFLLGWAAFVGLGGALALMLSDPRLPGGLLPWWVDVAWYLLLGLGAVLVLVGTWWRDALTGVLIARAGYWPTGAGGIIYALLLGLTDQARSGIIICGFSIACVWRAMQIRRDVRIELTDG